jgi:hypothetical protein
MSAPSSASANSDLSAALPLIAPLFAFCLALGSPAVLNDGDTWWHLATGQWILAHHYVPTTDVFSFSAVGTPWSAHEWLTEILLALAFKLAGWSGVVVLTGAAVAGALLIVTRRALHDGLTSAPLLTLTMISFSLISASLLVRPHVFGLLLLAFWITQLMAARDADRAPPFWLLGIMLFWVNMHASFLLGLAMIGPFALEAVLESPPEQRFKSLREWSLFGLAAALISLVNPQGYEAFVYPVQVMNMRLLPRIIEWRPVTFEHFKPIEIALLALIGMALIRPVRLKPLRLVLLLGVIHLALHQSRQEMILAIVAPLLLAGPMAAAFPATEQPAPDKERMIWRGAFIVMALVAALRLLTPIERIDSPTAPISALATVPPQLRAQPVLNELGFGGFLIFSKVKPFIDGRTDMYGDPFFFNYDSMVEGDGATFDAELPKYGFKWALLPPAAPLVKALAARPDWKKIYSDKFAVVFVRADQLNLAQ